MRSVSVLRVLHVDSRVMSQFPPNIRTEGSVLGYLWDNGGSVLFTIITFVCVFTKITAIRSFEHGMHTYCQGRLSLPSSEER